MDLNRKVSDQNKLKKIFGIGPTGAIFSLFLLAIFVWANSIAFDENSVDNIFEGCFIETLRY
jgi:hypothetical protein